jgi:hypothetical protein
VGLGVCGGGGVGFVGGRVGVMVGCWVWGEEWGGGCGVLVIIE